MCITMRKVVLHDILTQIVQKLYIVAILDFSVSASIFACCPADIQYRGHNDVKSTIKKTLSFQAVFG